MATAAPLNPPSPPAHGRIGLMGGSFNPAHDGHLHIARLALEHLALDAVWWLVSPQNPLKDAAGMAPFDARLNTARDFVQAEPHIHVSDAEHRLGVHHTARSLPRIASAHPGARFVWIMGADNLLQMDQWADWQTIFHTLPIAVFARPPYDSGILDCPAAQHFAAQRHHESGGAELADCAPPAWIYFDTPRHDQSATKIRTRHGGQP